MKIPAEALTWTNWFDLAAGQIAKHGDDWLLVVQVGMASERSKPALMLTGPATGALIDLAGRGGYGSGSLLTIGNGYAWRPMLDSLPPTKAEENAPGALLFGPYGPFLRSWAEGDWHYAFTLFGSEIGDPVRGRVPSCDRWTVTLVGPGLTAPVVLFVAEAAKAEVA